ncbi:MAG: hypothetical protein ACYC6Y_30990, partial [Thermoguttaceae bacterium]
RPNVATVIIPADPGRWERFSDRVASHAVEYMNSQGNAGFATLPARARLVAAASESACRNRKPSWRGPLNVEPIASGKVPS